MKFPNLWVVERFVEKKGHLSYWEATYCVALSRAQARDDCRYLNGCKTGKFRVRRYRRVLTKQDLRWIYT